MAESDIPNWTGEIQLYHGTIAAAVGSLRTGVDLNRSAVLTDFGPGFYMTSNRMQAWRWAQKKADDHTARDGTATQPAVMATRFRFAAIPDADLLVLGFAKPAIENGYWSFVRMNRGLQDAPPPNRPYDLVIGPVAETWNVPARLAAWRDFDQYSFHTPAALDALSPLEEVRRD